MTDKDHLMQYITDPTSCREMIIDICEWLDTAKPSPKSNLTIKSYPVDEPGVRFCLTSPGNDHFFCIKYQRKCAELHFYRSCSTEKPSLPPYMSLVIDNHNWIRINGANVAKLSIEDLKGHVREAYRHRFGELFTE